MNHLVGGLLQLSRLQAGELPLAREPLDLAEFLRASARRFEPAAAEAGVALRVDTGPVPVLFEGDRARLNQVLGNLIDNALRHTPRGGSVDLLGRVAEGGPAPRLEIVVRDTGAGIPAEDLPRVFERFYQADKSRAAGRGGAGLGLAIVKELVELHGGAMRAESAPGRGTAITIALPLDGAAGGGRQAAVRGRQSSAVGCQ